MSNLLEQVFLQINAGMIVVDRDCNVELCNHFMSDYSNLKVEDIVGKNLFEIYSYLPEKWLRRRIENIFLLKNSSFISWQQRPYLFDFASSRPVTGVDTKMVQTCNLFPVFETERAVSHVCLSVNDVTTPANSHLQLKKASSRLLKEKQQQQQLIKQLEETKSQLLQSEKMASIGQLSAGVAHEINNPVGFIKSNFSSLKHYAKELKSVITLYDKLLDTVSSDEVSHAVKSINEEHDVDFVIEDISSLIEESFDGVNRIEEIVKSLKNFSRNDTNEWEKANVNEGIVTTLKVVAHELKYLAEMKTDLAELPMIDCLPMQINQVVMNLLVNAAQAIDPNNKEGCVSVSTELKDDSVWIKIQDNGKGINKKTIDKIFDPFFTTKDVGKGTGLGLSLSYSIIEKHNGKIEVESEEGVGTLFIIQLPVQQSTIDVEEAKS